MYAMVLLGTWARAQPSLKPLTKDNVIHLLQGNVSPKRVEALAHEHGIDFQITPGTQDELRQAGADDALLSTLSNLAPKYATLTLQSNIGACQAFVDGGKVGDTDARGRLEIPNLEPGEHKIELFHTNYVQFMGSVEVFPGESRVLRVNMEPLAPSPGGEVSAHNTLADGLRGDLVEEAVFTSNGGKGTLFLSNGRLRFSPAKGRAPAFDMPLTDVVPLGIDGFRVNFRLQWQDDGKSKKREYWFNVDLFAKDYKASIAASKQAATDLFEALKAASSLGFTLNDVCDLLKKGVRKDRVAFLVQQKGVSFVLDEVSERKIRDAGGDAELLLVIAKAKK
jgi:hypothetical protein